MAAWQQCSPLDDVMLDLKMYINIPSLRPLFRSTHLLTELELEQLDISANNPTDRAVDRLVSFLKRKGPDHANKFLSLLQRSLREPDPHLGHEHLCERLQQVMEERHQEVESVRRAVEQLPVSAGRPAHRSVQQMDSGVVLHGSPGSRSSRSESCNSSRIDIGIEADDSLDRESMLGKYQMSSKSQLSIPGLSDVRYGRSREGLDQQHFKLMEDFKTITTCFAMMVLALYRTLKKKDAPVDEVRITLMYLGCEPGKSKEESTRLFPSPDEFAEAKDIGNLIECLRSYSSWYNYRLMKIVAEQFAGEEGKKLISDYEENLRKHYVNLIASQCPKFTLGQGLPPGYTHLIVKVNWDYQLSRLQDVVHFQSNLAELLELKPHVFQLRSVEEGCVLITWAIPKVLEQLVANMTAAQREILEAQGVVYLQTEAVFTRVAYLDGVHSLPLEARNKPLPYTHTNSETMTSQPSTWRSPLSSSSSSMASVLDLPMTEIEAELLSNYSGDVDDLSKGSLQKQSGVQLDEDAGEVETLGKLSLSHLPTPTDEVSGQTWDSRPNAAHMAKSYHSEDNLLTPPSAESQHNSRRAVSKFSLPDLCEKNVVPNDCNMSTGRKTACSKSLVHRLKKAPSKLFLKLFRSPRQTPVVSVETLCDPDPTTLETRDDFPIFQLREEPKGSWYQYVLLSPTATEKGGLGCAQGSSHSLVTCIPNIVTSPSTSPPETKQKMNSNPSATTEDTLLPCPIYDRRNSLRSPLLTPLTDFLQSLNDDPDTERADTRHSSMTSGIVSASPSMISARSRHLLSQTSVESEERSSLYSCEPNLSDARKDSVISVYSSLYSNPIYERPCDESEVRSHLFNEMPEQTEDYISFLERNRAHSYGEDFYRKINRRGLSAVCNSDSSGYSSWANSNLSSLQSSMAHVAESQESLETAPPFPYPHTASVKRGGSLKAYSRYSTRNYNNNYHVKVHQSHKSLD